MYRFARTLPTDAVIVEFPFGDESYELRYVYYSTVHWRRLLNGYSGGFPAEYMRRRAALGRLPDEQEIAWEALRGAGATHAILHLDAYRDGRGEQVAGWLRDRGARELASFGGDRVFALPAR